jgi:hypothetical protein
VENKRWRENKTETYGEREGKKREKQVWRERREEGEERKSVEMNGDRIIIMEGLVRKSLKKIKGGRTERQREKERKETKRQRKY